MKKWFWVWCVFISVNALAQNRANVWELGYSTYLMYPNCEMQFNNGEVNTNSIARIMSMFVTNSSICDTNGNLLFYTNGLTIGNSNYDTLQNAVDFNPGALTEFYEPDGMGICQGTLIIPDPGNDLRYYMFYITGEWIILDSSGQAKPLYLSFSIIDMNLDGGLGGIVDSVKNVHIIKDTLSFGGLTACKHANGTDWWIIAHESYSNTYYKLLVTKDGIKGPFTQEIGSVIPLDYVQQATFSPDGSRFCWSSYNGWFDYMEFNRCNGEFSNAVTVYNPDSAGFYGNSFSSNSRFLYASSKYDLYQFDTWNTDLAGSAIHIATWDSFDTPLPVLFFMHQLAPDNKIYISPWSGVSLLNVINEPDNLGMACNFEPHSFELPTWNFNIPSFPNYDLSQLPGGDTCSNVFSFVKPLSTKKFIYRIAPNPVSDWLNIIYQSEEDALFELFDLYGKRVGAISLFHYFKNRLLNVSHLPNGVYIATVTCKGAKVWSEQVVVQR